MRVASDDGAFQVDDVAPLRDGARRRAHFRVALVAGLLLGLAQSLGIALLLGQGKRGGRETAAAGNAVAAPKGAWWLLAGTTALCLLAAWFIGRGLQKRTSPGVFSDTGDYALVFVDHLGRRLSEKEGNLKLSLDPHSFYRNFPNQRSARFSIDSHGYRGGFDETDPRPRVLVLGGSAAFGYGLDSDTDLFTVRLGKIQPHWQVVNAAVVGHLSGQELSELLHHGDEVSPAAVVVLDGWNDLYVPLLAATRFQAAGLGVGFNWDVFHLVESRLRLLTLAGAADEATSGALEPLPVLVRRITTAYTANITKMKAICAARGVPLLVVLQPWLATRRAPEPDEGGPLKGWKGIGERADPRLYDTFVAEVRRVLATEGIPCIDLHGAGPFLDTPGRLFTDVVHMTPAGQQLAALEIEKPLTALLRASPGSPSAAKNR